MEQVTRNAVASVEQSANSTEKVRTNPKSMDSIVGQLTALIG
jgi:hypothetical protein